MSDSISMIADEIMQLVLYGATVDWRPNMAQIAQRLRKIASLRQAATRCNCSASRCLHEKTCATLQQAAREQAGEPAGSLEAADASRDRIAEATPAQAVPTDDHERIGVKRHHMEELAHVIYADADKRPTPGRIREWAAELSYMIDSSTTIGGDPSLERKA